MKKLLLLAWLLVGCKEQVTEQQVEECTENGIAYFRSIGSYPNLISNGKSAEQVAAERCNVSITENDWSK